MDEIVRQALARWPSVPACVGWLALDRRGVWRMRDEPAQAAGARGEPIRHDALIGFINRNYGRDEAGRWFFQNGPQRVFVELEYTPWIVRLADAAGGLTLTDHCGMPFDPVACWLDDGGNVLFSDGATPARIALLHDQDLDLFAGRAVFDEQGGGEFSAELRHESPERAAGLFHWRPGCALAVVPIGRAEICRRFAFVASPAGRVAQGSG